MYYGPYPDPVKAGFDALPGLKIPLKLCLGYPVMQARIESFTGPGYRMLCGWIQIVTREYLTEAGIARQYMQHAKSADLAPSMDDLGSPYAAYGFLPMIYDALCMNLGDNVELIWIADTFLTTVPLRNRQEEITWLAGFRWGYREYTPSAYKSVELLPLESTDQHVWNGHLPLLSNEFDKWRFKQSQQLTSLFLFTIIYTSSNQFL